MKCPAGSVENPEDNNFCVGCGEALRPLPSDPNYANVVAKLTSLRSELGGLKDALRSHGIEVAIDPDVASRAPVATRPPSAPSITTPDRVY